jgi:hypothetical protein
MRGLTSALVVLVTVLAAEPARAAVVLAEGGVGVDASADARCADPPLGDVERPFDGDNTLPYEAAVTADVSVGPCNQGASQHTAHGEASASGAVNSAGGVVTISAEGSVNAFGVDLFEASGTANFEQTFTVDAPTDYALTSSGRVSFDRDIPDEGTLEPGTYKISAVASCSASGSDPDGCGGTGFSLTLELGTLPDSDGDGLFDPWETDGIPANGSVPALDLPALGADPQHKDVFVELDHLEGHALDQSALDAVIAAFAAAPVGNPDGAQGITLHVDDGDELPHDPVLGFPAGAGDYDWSEFDALKDAHFAPERAPAFHYGISAHRMESNSESSSGISREIPASDFIVSLGPMSEPQHGAGTAMQQAGTFMHELGHNLGLRHGGNDHRNDKPNRLSVMNYSFQFSWLPRVNAASVLDYSRFSIPLNENALNEDRGFGFPAGSPEAAFYTVYLCPDGALEWAFLQADSMDWDCDGTESGIVASDVNGDNSLTSFPGFADWPNLVYDGGAVGGAGAALPQQTESIEPPVEEIVATTELLEQAQASGDRPRLKPPSGGGGGGGGGGTADDPPGLSGLAVRPRSFRAGRRAAIRFGATLAGHVRFAVERKTTGRRVKGRCAKRTRRNRRARRCSRFVRLKGSFSTQVTPGQNSVAFRGRLRGRALPAGSYRLVATPLSAVQRRPGGVRRAAFRIQQPRVTSR